MSFPALAWAVRQKLPSTQKLVLVMLAERHNKDSGQCNPSLELLAEDCGLSRRSVIDQIAKLQDVGYLTVRHRAKDSVRLPSQYVLHLGFGVPEKVQTEANDPYLMPKKVVSDVHQGSEPFAPPQCSTFTTVVNDVHQGSERAAHKPVIEPGIEPGNEPVVGAVAQQPVKKPPSRATALPSDFWPDDTAQRMAGELGLSLQDELAAFCDHHAAKGTTFKDWQAGFRTWLRNSAKYRQQARPGGRGGAVQQIDPHTPVETYAQRAARQRMEEVAPMAARKAPGQRCGFAAAQAFMNGGDVIDVTPVHQQRIGG
ncbi:MAG: helix-turn-helix domain-containing protein [Acidovorax sp.]|nr:helix-turn-helix domain-containing protein [Acidovorax sp.]